MSLLEKATCKIEVEIKDGVELEKGTGFFINDNQILTCKHVVNDCTGKIFISKCYNQKEGFELTAKVIDSCALCDYALIELNEKFRNGNNLKLCDSEIIKEEKWKAFGYPKTEEGEVFGENLKGSVKMFIENNNNNNLTQDINLNVDPAIKSDYSGFSGSPILNDYGDVVAIIKYQAERHLSAVSTKKAFLFLKKNKVYVKPDQLQSFAHYSEGIFDSFREESRINCETNRDIALKEKSPTSIIKELNHDIFYPKETKSLKDIISRLRTRKELNSELWEGWIKLLTYVQLLKGESSEINNIRLNLTEVEMKSVFGFSVGKKTTNVTLHLNFYFTEEKSYFSVAKKHISNLLIRNAVPNNFCVIFNSIHNGFDDTTFSKKDRLKLVVDIASPSNSGFNIGTNVDFGILSLRDLTKAVANCTTIMESCNNLENTFKDAIKQS